MGNNVIFKGNKHFHKKEMHLMGLLFDANLGKRGKFDVLNYISKFLILHVTVS